MPFDVLIRISEDSRRGQAIKKMAADQNTTPEKIVERMIDDGVAMQAQQFKEIDSRLTQRRGARAPLRRDDVTDSLGAFAESSGFCESIATVISSRANRYGGGD